MSQPGVTLGDVMRLIKKEIQAAEEETTLEDAAMQFIECEFEFAVTVENAVAGSELRLYVVNAGSGTETEGAPTASNRVKLRYATLPEMPFVTTLESLEPELPKPVRKNRKNQG